MNTQLIADAVRNCRGRDEATVWDRLFSFWFQRLVYTQIWEDPEADLAALRLPLGSSIVTISSGGCNALSYITARPAQVYAVDLNEAHLSLLQLKIAGLRTLSDYAQFWQFFGDAASKENIDLYLERLRPMLDVSTRSYWDKRTFLDARDTPISLMDSTVTACSADSSALATSGRNWPGLILGLC